MSKFQCFHCGYCCTNKNLQAGITLGDVQRIVFLTKLYPEKLVKDGVIGLIATGNPDKGIFDTDLGLVYPCKFRKNEQCTIYPSRPLNCQMFPAGFFAEIKSDEVEKFIDNNFKCRHSLVECKKDTINNVLLMKYKHEVGNIILEESETTEHFMKENGFARAIDISRHKDFELLKKNLSKSKKEASCQKLFFAESMINEDFHLKERLAKALKQWLSQERFRTREGIPYLE
jgi:Fe-S-cluster containining protein